MEPTKNCTKINVLNITQCTLTIIGTVVGAGFASGKEISTFIGAYNNSVYIASILFSIIFFVGQLLIYNSINKQQNIKLKKAVTTTIFISEFISFTAMLSALDSTLNMVFTSRLPYILSLILIYLIILFGINGLNKGNLLLIPMLIFFIIFIGIDALKSNEIFSIYKPIESNLIFSIFALPLYAGLNLYCAYPIILELSPLQNKKEKTLSALLSSLIILIMLLCMCATVLNSYTDASTTNIPLLFYIFVINPKLLRISAIVLAIAIFTTAVSDGFVIKRILDKKTNYSNFIILIMYIFAYILSKIGFDKIVMYLYPITGALGIIILTLIFILPGKNLQKTTPL